MLRLAGTGGFWGVVGLELSAEALAEALSIELSPGKRVPHRAISGGQASWLSGVPATGSWAAVPAVSPQYATELTLCASAPAPRDATALAKRSPPVLPGAVMAGKRSSISSSFVACTARTVVLRRILLTGDGFERLFIFLGFVLIWIAVVASALHVGSSRFHNEIKIDVQPEFILNGVPIRERIDVRTMVAALFMPNVRDIADFQDDIALFVGLALEHFLYWGIVGMLTSSRFTLVGVAPSLSDPGLYMFLLAHLLASASFAFAVFTQLYWRAGWLRPIHLCLLVYNVSFFVLLAAAAVAEGIVIFTRALFVAAQGVRGAVTATATFRGAQQAKASANRDVSRSTPQLFVTFGIVQGALRIGYPSSSLLLGAISARTVS